MSNQYQPSNTAGPYGTTASYAPGEYPPDAPPLDDGSHIHPTQRAVIWVVRAITYLLYAYLLLVEIILFLGFFLLLAGANPSSGFVEWVYRNLDRVMEPFRGIFTPIELGAGANEVESIFETSVVFAMIIYGIVAIAIYGLASWLSRKMQRLDIEDREYHRRMAIERAAWLNRQSAERIAAAQTSQTAQTGQTGQTGQAPGSQPGSGQAPPAGNVPPPPPGS